MNTTYRINGIEASPAEQVAFRVGYKTARDQYAPMIRELELDLESVRDQLREVYRDYFKQQSDFDVLLKENLLLRQQLHGEIRFMESVKTMKKKIDPRYDQAQRDLNLIHPHPYSSAIDGNWLFVVGYDKPMLYWRLR